MKTSHFVKISGIPILDFANTWVQHATEVEDRLTTTQATEMFFREVFETKIDPSPADFRLIVARRKDLRKLFDDLIKAKTKLNLSSLWPFNSVMKGMLHFSINPMGPEKPKVNRIHLQLQNPIDTVLLKYTLDFLQNFEPEKLKKCHSDNCSHFFYDTSKASSRRWCSMKSCGNLAKVRNFRRMLK